MDEDRGPIAAGWGEEVASFLAGLARFGVVVSLGTFAFVAAMALVPGQLPGPFRVFLLTASWGVLVWTCVSAGIALALGIRGALVKSTQRGVWLTLGGALALFAGALLCLPYARDHV